MKPDICAVFAKSSTRPNFIVEGLFGHSVRQWSLGQNYECPRMSVGGASLLLSRVTVITSCLNRTLNDFSSDSRIAIDSQTLRFVPFQAATDYFSMQL